ncbi:MAG TPA: hypothetical protein VE641_21640, partial [Chthoniobacterales bacterium]|nr:hypothetical protein [Chthoniobacterales bacterium]
LRNLFAGRSPKAGSGEQFLTVAQARRTLARYPEWAQALKGDLLYAFPLEPRVRLDRKHSAGWKRTRTRLHRNH